MKLFSKKNLSNQLNLLNILKVSLYLLPVSLILGNAAVNLNSIIIIINLILIFSFKKELFRSYQKIFLIFSLFLIVIIFNIIFSDNIKLSIVSSLGLIRYFLLMLGILYCLENDERFLLNYCKFLVLILMFVAGDTLFQYFFGTDIFGIKATSSHGQRLNGPFGNEYIVGAYLSKLFFISLIFFIISHKNYFYLFLYLIFILSVTLLTKERMASLMLIFTCGIFFIFLSKINLKIKILYISIFLIFCSVLILTNKSIKDHLVIRSLEQIGIIDKLNIKKEVKKNSQNQRIFFDSRWGAHYLTAYNIFIDNPILGSGIKTFRIKCSEKKYENITSESKETRCNTHPHNIYLEIISEGGLTLFLPFILFNLIIIYILILNIFKFNKTNNLSLVILCNFLMLYFPVQTSGSFFSTWNGFYYWFVYAFVAFEFRRIKN